MTRSLVGQVIVETGKVRDHTNFDDPDFVFVPIEVERLERLERASFFEIGSNQYLMLGDPRVEAALQFCRLCCN
jgi:hypothetical protein